jgi:hypothetical protein
MASRNIGLPTISFWGFFNRGAAARPKTDLRIAPHPEDGLLVEEPRIGSKNYSEERLRADTGRCYQYVGRNMFR